MNAFTDANVFFSGQSCPKPGSPGSSDAVKAIFKEFNSVVKDAVAAM
jgi:hypothetical protein